VNKTPKILISAYACSPKYGSEPGMGWNWINQISEHFETWVLTDEYYAAHCREYLERQSIAKPKLHLVGIPRPGGRHRIYGYFWLHYLTQNLWQRKAFKIAKELHAREHFDLVHQLNMIGYREPGYLWQLDESRPYVWGPIGGHAQMPIAFLSSLDLKNRVIYRLRNSINAWQMNHLRRVRRAISRANVLFSATGADANAIRRIHGRDSVLLNETCTVLQTNRCPTMNRFTDHNSSTELIWAGVFIGCKGLPIALHSLAQVRRQKPDIKVRLTIVGDGPCNLVWKRLAEKLEVSDLCIWLGWVTHDQAQAQIAGADAMLLTSLKEATTNVVTEAISHGIPVICHDACGFGDVVTKHCGIKIPMIDPQTSINGFANAIIAIAQDRVYLADLSQGALARAHELTWEKKAKIMVEQYQRLLD
jgi:glycosyltransferase involved in cell wall biosynthesis